MRPGGFISSLALLGMFSLASAGGAHAQVLDPLQYQLGRASGLEYGCFSLCECPIAILGPLSGSFTLARTSVDPLFDHYALLNIAWDYSAGDSAAGTERKVHVSGRGTYDIGGEFALMQRMTLDVSSNGDASQRFESGWVVGGAGFPAIDIDVHSNLLGCLDSILHVVAKPLGVASVEPLPGRGLLWRALPNPTSGGVDVVFTPASAEHARVDVVDVRGRIVATLVNGSVSPGEYRLRWNGRDARGADSGAGIFWIRAEVGSRTDQVRIVRLK